MSSGARVGWRFAFCPSPHPSKLGFDVRTTHTEQHPGERKEWTANKNHLKHHPTQPCPRTCPAIPYPTLPYPTTPHPTLPYPTLPYPTLPYPTLPYPTLPYPTLPYPTLPYPTLPSAVQFLVEIFSNDTKIGLLVVIRDARPWLEYDVVT